MALRLTTEEWDELRAQWETDPRTGYQWLAEECDKDVSAATIRKRAHRHAWRKCDNAGDAENQNAEASESASSMAEELLDGGMLSLKEKAFVAEYIRDFNGRQAAIRAGYSPRSAGVLASRLLKKVNVQRAIKDAVIPRAVACGMDGESLMRLWADTINFDPTEVMQYRNTPCPHCWSEDGNPQYTEASYYAEKKLHDRMRMVRLQADSSDDIGPFPPMTAFAFINENQPPNPACPVCHGVGRRNLFYTNPSDLSPTARRLMQGYEVGKGEVNVRLMSKEKAADNLAKALRLFADKDESAETPTMNIAELNQLFEDRMKAARERTAEIFRRREKAGFNVSESDAFVEYE